MHNGLQVDIPKEAMHDLFWKRRDKRSQAVAKTKTLTKGTLVMVYNSALDKTFQRINSSIIGMDLI